MRPSLLVGFVLGAVSMRVLTPSHAPCPPPSPPPPPTLPEVAWADSVLGYSTQYTDQSWSAAQALGMPNVYPQHGDIPKAWASLDADGHAEWLELGYSRPRRVAAIEIYETYNPGAIDSVELITTSGRRIHLLPQSTADHAGARRLVIPFACTNEAVAAVRLNVASHLVAGWNEIDAVGLVPCADGR